MTRGVARSLCDSWVSCSLVRRQLVWNLHVDSDSVVVMDWTTCVVVSLLFFHVLCSPVVARRSSKSDVASLDVGTSVRWASADDDVSTLLRSDTRQKSSKSRSRPSSSSSSRTKDDKKGTSTAAGSRSTTTESPTPRRQRNRAACSRKGDETSREVLCIHAVSGPPGMPGLGPWNAWITWLSRSSGTSGGGRTPRNSRSSWASWPLWKQRYVIVLLLRETLQRHVTLSWNTVYCTFSFYECHCRHLESREIAISQRKINWFW